MNKMIEELQKTSFYNELLFKEDTKIACLCGSNLIGFKDERSDFDILCICENSIKHREYNEYLMWNNTKVHFIYNDFNNLFNPNTSSLDIMSLTQLPNLKTNNTVFYNSNDKMLNFIIDNANEILKIGLYILYNYCNHLILEVCNNGITERTRTKYLYHIVYAKRKYLNENIDNDYLTKLKRIRWQEIDKSYIEQCVADLKELKDYITSNPYDIVKACEDLKKKWLNVL